MKRYFWHYLMVVVLWTIPWTAGYAEEAEKAIVGCQELKRGMTQCDPYKVKFLLLRPESVAAHTSPPKRGAQKIMHTMKRISTKKRATIDNLIAKYIKREDTLRHRLQQSLRIKKREKTTTTIGTALAKERLRERPRSSESMVATPRPSVKRDDAMTHEEIALIDRLTGLQDESRKSMPKSDSAVLVARESNQTQSDPLELVGVVVASPQPEVVAPTQKHQATPIEPLVESSTESTTEPKEIETTPTAPISEPTKITVVPTKPTLEPQEKKRAPVKPLQAPKETKATPAVRIDTPKKITAPKSERPKRVRLFVTSPIETDLSKLRRRVVRNTADHVAALPKKRARRSRNTADHVAALPIKEDSKPLEPKIDYATYRVSKGDSLLGLSVRLSVGMSELIRINKLKESGAIYIGQKLKIPLSQEKVDTILKGTYVVKPGDSLGMIAKRFELAMKDLKFYNNIKKGTIHPGQKLDLPFPHIIKKLKKRGKIRKKLARIALKKKRKAIVAREQKQLKRQSKGKFKRKLRVLATAYTSHVGQTDKTPFLAAWNNRIWPGMKIVAVSNDLIRQYGITNGSHIKISGLPGIYTVRDKMNRRWRKKVDIYMGTDRRRALRWGRKRVVISY